MENLNALHRETVEVRNQNQKAKAKRESQLAARLKKVRDKKRLKMGLPPLPEKEELNGPKKVTSIEDSISLGLKDIRHAEENNMRKSIGTTSNNMLLISFARKAKPMERKNPHSGPRTINNCTRSTLITT